MSTQDGYLQRSPHPSSLYDVLNLILDKGLVIDLYVRASLIGIEVLTIDARIVIASVDTYLRFAEAVNRLDLEENGGLGLPDLLAGATEKTYETGARVEDQGGDREREGEGRGDVGRGQGGRRGDHRRRRQGSLVLSDCG